MKIAYISADFGIPIDGGEDASIHCREMVAALSAAGGHAVWVISPALATTANENAEKVEKVKPGETLHLVPAPLPCGSPVAEGLDDVMLWPVPPHEHHLQLLNELETLDKFLGMPTQIALALRSLLYNLTFYEQALHYLRPRQIDFVYERYSLFNYAGLRLARALGVPHLLEVHASFASEQGKTSGLETKALAGETERRLFVEADRVIVVSRQLQAVVITYGVPVGRIVILPTAVDPQRFDPQRGQGMAVRTQYRLINKRIIGFVGNLKTRHGIETLVVAFRRLQTIVPYAHLLIVGDGPGREELENYAQANELNGKVTFVG